MNERLAEMLQAHVNHELVRFREPQLMQDIEQEVDRFYQWADAITLTQLIPQDQMLIWVRRFVVEVEQSETFQDWMVEQSRRFHAFEPNQHNNLETLVTRDVFDGFATKTIQLKKLRDALIQFALQSSAYHAYISEVVCAFMKEYIVRENLLAQKVPGVSSLLKMGKSAVNRAMPGLEDTLESSMKAFIQANLGRVAKLSEQFLIANLDQDSLSKLTNGLWQTVAFRPVADYLGYLSDDDLAGFAQEVLVLWQHFRATPYCEQLLVDWVGAFYARFGSQPLAQVLGDLGLEQSLVRDSVKELLVSFCRSALASGYLEERIRERLSDFYNSEQAAAILS